MAGLILGMLIYEGNGNFDQISNLVNQRAANYVHLDTVLKHYGPETTLIRSELRGHLKFNLRKFWPEECGGLTPPSGHEPKALRYFEWVLRGEATEPLLLRKNREDIEYGTQP
jgi:hypothetical protein